MTLPTLDMSRRFYFLQGGVSVADRRDVLVFLNFLQTFIERQILWSLCLVTFHALTLKLPIQTSLSVAPKLPVSLRPGKKCKNFRKTSTALVNQNKQKC